MTKSLHTERHRRLVALLKEMRISRGLTQDELSKRLRRTQSYIANIERGQRRIDVVELLDLADVLEFDVLDALDRVKTDRRS